MTEEQAFTKWCPQMPRDARDSSVHPNQCCIGSLCMWWRRLRDENGYATGTEGFCGKAGKP